ncbi:MAG TPA: N-acetyl-gamma-glutamyl-phosphate reductase [Polyangia bacterium]
MSESAAAPGGAASRDGARIRAGIVGVSGYSGMEAARILARHPRFSLNLAISDKWGGRALGSKLALGPQASGLTVLSQEQGKAAFGTVDVLFFCTPAEVSIDLAPVALAAGARVVDVSGAFRLAAADYPGWYGFTHHNPGLLDEAVYSMPEAGFPDAAARLRKARLVSNPGCYPTVSSLAVLPLLRAGLIEAGSIIIDAKSGTTGTGRKGTEELSFSEVDGDFRAYRILRHQHTPEIERVLSLAGIPGGKVVFTAHLLPARRGILATAYGRLTPAALAAPNLDVAVSEALAAFAEGKPFVRVVGPEEVTLSASVGTNRVVMGAKADASRGIVVACASIDNLVKGAAGQAVQNANLMFGLPETLGLDDLVGHLP